MEAQDSYGPSTGTLVNVTNGSEAYPKYWFAALVQINSEKRVASKLNQLNIENYVPTQQEVHQWSDRKKKVDRIVIPSIVFVHIDRRTERQLRQYSFIYRLLSYPGEKMAAIIPDNQIEQLKLMLNNANTNVEVTGSIYEIGEEVEIVQGPLKGISGELCYFEKGKPKVGIYLELLGYACVSVNIDDVISKNK